VTRDSTVIVSIVVIIFIVFLTGAIPLYWSTRFVLLVGGSALELSWSLAF
jgi:hypothetical protein